MKTKNVVALVLAAVALFWAVPCGKSASGSAGGLSWTSQAVVGGGIDEDPQFDVHVTGTLSATSTETHTTIVGLAGSGIGLDAGSYDVAAFLDGAFFVAARAGVIGSDGSVNVTTQTATVNRTWRFLAGQSHTFYIVRIEQSWDGNYVVNSVSSVTEMVVSFEGAGTYSTSIRVHNSGAFNQQIQLVQGGVTVHTFEVASGGTVLDNYTQWTVDNMVTIIAHVSGVQKVGESFVLNGGESHDQTLGSVQPVATEPQILNLDSPGVGQTTPDAKKGVWTGTQTALDASLYREGVDRQVAAINGLAAANSGSGGGSSAALESLVSATNSKLDAAATAQQTRDNERNDKIDAVGNKVGALVSLLHPADNAEENPSQRADTQKAQAEARAMAPVVSGVGRSVPAVDSSSDGLTLWEQNIGGENIKVGFAVAQILPSGHTMLLAGRILLEMVFVVVVWKKAMQELRTYLIAMGSVNDGGANVGIENALPSVAQAKQFTQAAIVTVGIFTAVILCVGLVDAMVALEAGEGHGVVAMMAGGKFTMSVLGPIIGVLDRYIPVGPGIVFQLEIAAMPALMAPVYGGVMALVKAVKP